MEHYAGIDVSLEESSVCVVDATGTIVREVKIASEPEALVRYFDELQLPVGRIGLESGPLSQWLHAGLVAAGRDAVLLETRHVKAALSAMTVKTDRKDARGIAQLLRMGWYRPVHAKSVTCKDSRALLVGRKLLQSKLLDVELSIRGILAQRKPAPISHHNAVRAASIAPITVSRVMCPAVSSRMRASNFPRLTSPTFSP